ncbi:MAG: flagellar hook-basal body complex protein, partial [Bermanella sp.]
GANTITVQVQVTDNQGTTTTNNVVLDNTTGGVAGLNTTLAEVQAALSAGTGVDVTVTQPPLTFTGAGANASGGTIALVPLVETGITLTQLGFSTSNRLNIGTPDITPNNLFNIQVTGPTAAENSAAWNITIPAGSYATLDDLAAAMQTEIDQLIGATGVAGRVQVEGVGGQLLLTNTEIGAGYAAVLTQHSTYLPAADALSSFTALGFNNMFTITGTDDIDRTNSFRINLTVPAPDLEGRSGTTTITLDEDFRSVQQVAASINRQVNSLDSEAFIGVRAEAIEITPNVVPPQYQLQFVATETGEPSIITITEFLATGEDITVDQLYGLVQVDEDDNSLLTLGIEGVSNEYPATDVTITDPEGVESVITIPADTEANAIASIFNRQPGVTASATSTATVTQSGYNSPGNNLRMTLNGQALTSTSLADLAEEINSFFGTTLPGFNATIDDGGDLVINNSIGRDILIEVTSPTVTDSVVVTGSPNAGPVVLGGTSTADSAVAIGGSIEFILNEDYTLSNPVPAISGVFGALTENEFEDFVINSFNPDDQDTYNHATSTTIYDSLGNSHIMTQFFVKEPLDSTRPNEENIWAMYVRVDGRDVGDPDATLAFPENLVPTSARFELFFNSDGSLDELTSGDFFITNWDPMDETGAGTGSLSSVNVLEGGLPLTSPANSSNFQIFLDGSSQFASAFSVAEVSQNGFTTGRLTGLETDSDGLMFARFTNGQAQILGQVALASFKNPEGLNPLGSTSWGETFESGGPTVGSPRTGTFGNLRSSSLEDSNVDLSEELVGLIIAQRNFQASAKTIETSDTVTQTIIQQ